MITIFEGPDHSGKDTLIEKMMKNRECIYFYNSTYPSQAHAMKAYRSQLNIVKDIITHTFGDLSIIFNRAHISSKIYGEIIRDEKVIDAEYYAIEQQFLELNAQVIRCLPPKEIVLAGWEGRLDEEYVKDTEQMSKVYDYYAQDFDSTTDLPYITHDFTKELEYANC